MKTLRQELEATRQEASAARQRAAHAEAACDELRRQVCGHGEALAGKADKHTLNRMQEGCHAHVQDVRHVAEVCSRHLGNLADKVRLLCTGSVTGLSTVCNEALPAVSFRYRRPGNHFYSLQRCGRFWSMECLCMVQAMTRVCGGIF